MQNRGEQNVHFKMYKDGKRWVTRGLALGAVSLMVVAPIATTNLQLTHVKDAIAATTTKRSLSQAEATQIDKLQNVIDNYRHVQDMTGTSAVWQGDLAGAITKATNMIQTIKSGHYTQANGSYSDGMSFADQQVQFQVDRVEDYALAIEVAYIREHNAAWYGKVKNGEVFADIHTDYLPGYSALADDGFPWMKHYLLEIVNGYLNETGKTTVGEVDKPATPDKPVTSEAVDEPVYVARSSSVDAALSVTDSGYYDNTAKTSTAVDDGVSVSDSDYYHKTNASSSAVTVTPANVGETSVSTSSVDSDDVDVTTVANSSDSLVNANVPASTVASSNTVLGNVVNSASNATTNVSTNNASASANMSNGVATSNGQATGVAANGAGDVFAPANGSNADRISVKANATVQNTTPQALKMLHASDDKQFDTLERSHVTETLLSVIIAIIAALMYKLLRNNKRDEADDMLAEEDERLFSDVAKISKIKK